MHRWLSGWIGILLALGAAAQDAQPEPGAVLVLGRVSDNPKLHYQSLKPLLDYVVPRMAEVGIREGRVLMARDHQQMVSFLRQGKVDWITETSGSAISLQDRTGARFLLRTTRGGRSDYRTVFFARRDSGMDSLDDLRGHTIAFQNPLSTSSYFTPAAEILGAGLPMGILRSPLDRPSNAVVGYVFALSEANISTWVHKRLIDAGAFSDQDWANLQRLPESYREDLVIFHRTEPVPRAIELVRADIDPRIEARLRAVLLAAGDDPLAIAALEAYSGTDRFDVIDDPTQEALLRLRDGVRRVRQEIE